MIVRISKTWSAVVTAVVMFGNAGPLSAHEPTGAPPAVPPAAVQGSTLVTPPAAVTPAASSRPIASAAAKSEGALAPVALDAVTPKEQDAIVLAGRRAETGVPSISRRQEKQMLSSIPVGVPVTTGTPMTPGAPVVQGMPAPTPAPAPAPAPEYAPIPSGTVVYDSSSPQPYTDDGTHGSQIVANGTTAFPQDCEASIRITDRPYTGSSPQSGELSKRDLRMVCPECRIAPDGLPYHMSQTYDPTERQIRRYSHWHGLVYPPDYGWCPPGKLPIDYVSIDYSRQFPGSWYGQPATCGVVRPQVYWPTDTTQLGYTYQHVPRWLPAYGMVPPVPHPDQWNIPHCTLCGADCRGCGRHNGVCPNCRQGNCPQGNCPTGSCPAGQAGNCPQCQPGGVIIEDGHHSGEPGEVLPVPSESLPPIAPAPLPPQSADLSGLNLNASSISPSLTPVPN